MKLTDEECLDNLDRENIVLASFAKRIYAFIIDEFLLSIIIIIVFWNILISSSDPSYVIDKINQNILFVLILKVSYHTFFTWFYGQSVGKILMKIRVVDTSSLDNPIFIMALNRALIRILFEFLFYIGFFFAFISPIRQTIHDKISKVVIVNDI